ncbi:MAG: shikimate dehydrogenase [Wenzhouxiangellaceae bacterium]|nr:shikimate dehydrogenase [Wenzhouxiangellaceae bacterium]
MAENGVTRLAVFGHPVTHSLSPAIHQRFADACRISVDYRAIDCPAGHLAEHLARFQATGGIGCNLTVPLKSEGLGLAASASAEAREAGACNTLRWSESGWQAYNTDAAGLVVDFRRLGIPLRQRRILIVGAGGAVAGILGALIRQRPEFICLLNRDAAKAQRLAARFAALDIHADGAASADLNSGAAKPGDKSPGDKSPDGTKLVAAGLDQGPPESNFDLLIQGTSLGHQGLCPNIDPGWLADDAIGYDLNYGAAYQAFDCWGSSAGVPTRSGIGMLVEQAALAFEIFTGQRPSTAAVHQWLGKSET